MMTLANPIGASSSANLRFGHLLTTPVEKAASSSQKSLLSGLHSHDHLDHSHSHASHTHGDHDHSHTFTPKPAVDKSRSYTQRYFSFVGEFFKNLKQSAFTQSTEPKTAKLGLLKSTKLWFVDYFKIIVEDLKRAWQFLSGQPITRASESHSHSHNHSHDGHTHDHHNHSNCGHDHHH
jgi:hypothetical protein